MNCPPLQTIEDYLIGALSADQRDQFDEHMKTCSSCAQVLARERELDGLLRSLTPLQAPEGFAKAIRSRLAAQAIPHTLPDWLWALGIGLLVTFLGVMAGRLGVPLTKSVSAEAANIIRNTGILNRINELGAVVQQDWFSQIATGNNVLILNLIVAGIILCWGLWQVVKALRG